jgi:hypothetical protein
MLNYNYIHQLEATLHRTRWLEVQPSKQTTIVSQTIRSDMGRRGSSYQQVAWLNRLEPNYVQKMARLGRTNKKKETIKHGPFTGT